MQPLQAGLAARATNFPTGREILSERDGIVAARSEFSIWHGHDNSSHAAFASHDRGSLARLPTLTVDRICKSWWTVRRFGRVATATHDIGIGSSRKGTKWFHRIDPHIDRERERIKNELMLSGVAQSYALVDRKHVAQINANATGDMLITDRKMLVLMLGSGERTKVALASDAPR